MRGGGGGGGGAGAGGGGGAGGGLNPIRKLILSTEHIDQNLNFVSEREGNFAELN